VCVCLLLGRCSTSACPSRSRRWCVPAPLTHSPAASAHSRRGVAAALAASQVRTEFAEQAAAEKALGIEPLPFMVETEPAKVSRCCSSPLNPTSSTGRPRALFTVVRRSTRSTPVRPAARKPVCARASVHPCACACAARRSRRTSTASSRSCATRCGRRYHSRPAWSHCKHVYGCAAAPIASLRSAVAGVCDVPEPGEAARGDRGEHGDVAAHLHRCCGAEPSATGRRKRTHARGTAGRARALAQTLAHVT
jgi:hypothetical protein